MTFNEMRQFIRIEHPITTNSVKVVYNNGDFEVGFFLCEEEEFNIENKWRFVSNTNSSSYRINESKEYTKIINGNDVSELVIL